MNLFNNIKNIIGSFKNMDCHYSDLPIDEAEKVYYQKDDYYQEIVYKGTPFEKKVVRFKDYIKNSIPSKSGLYVPEILLLSMCQKYPHPKSGYPGYWWFKYGIRNVGAVLNSLEDRGFIIIGENGKYELTEIGKIELEENQYVPYMHNHGKDNRFTIWDLNKLINDDNRNNYMEIIQQRENELAVEDSKQREKEMELLKSTDKELYDELLEQDEQLELIKKTEEEYKNDNDINKIISFWEEIWQNGGLKFNGSRWYFRIIELYISNKDYDKALKQLDKMNKPEYADRKKVFVEKINKLKNK